MKKLRLKDYAAIAEVIGTAGIIVSLLIVAYSVSRNTSAMQAASENVIYEQHSMLITKFMDNAGLASIRARLRSGSAPLSDTELVQWQAYQAQMLDVWGMTFNRYKRGLLAEDQWVGWNRYFRRVFANDKEGISKIDWEIVREDYADDFGAHFDAEVFNTEKLQDSSTN